MALNTVLKGDCDCCENVGVTVYVGAQGMKMCDSCKTKQDDAVAKAVEVNSMLAASREIDANIRIKTDVFQAKTVPAIELKGAIDADENIPAEQKDYVMAKESLTRYKALRESIFADRQALLEKENELRMWQTQVQNFAGKLHAERKEEFRNFDINYQPVPAKKPVKVSVGTSKVKLSDIKEMAAKYNVPAAAVSMIAAANKHMTAESAAKFLVEQKRIAAEKVAQKQNTSN